MIQQTSIDAYHEIREKGLLGRLQLEVLEIIVRFGPLTQNELHREHFAETQPRNVQPRVSELEARGVVRSAGQRPCRITGFVCETWEFTGELPHDPVRKTGARKIITELLGRVESLEKTVASLQEGRFESSGQGSLFTTYGKGH